MNYLRQLLSFFVYSNLFIAVCAVVMTDQTYRLVLREFSNPDFLFFVFFATICSYSFHWYLTPLSANPSPRILWIRKYRVIHLILFLVGLGGAGLYFYYLLPYWPWLMLSAIITFLYSAPKIPHPLFRSLRKVALGKTIFLAMVWMNVTSLLPILIYGQPWEADFTLFIISRFFFIYAICILFDYRDREDDKAAGIRSLITYLSEKSITWLFYGSLLVSAITTIWLYWYDYTLPSVTLLLIPAIITAGLYNYARKNFKDLFYYFVLDGLMAFSAILLLIGGF